MDKDPHPIMTLKSTYKAYPQLMLCSLLLVFLGALGGALYYHNTQLNQRERINLYGQAIATSAALQSVNAAMQQDLVSLQAILVEAKQYPYVLGVTIHNVENKLLVQSGFNPNRPEEGRLGLKPLCTSSLFSTLWIVTPNT